MPTRIAAIASLLAFTVCLVAGGFGAGNAFGTIVGRALLAMACTFAVGLIVGLMGQKMLEERLAEAGQPETGGQEKSSKLPEGPTGRVTDKQAQSLPAVQSGRDHL